MSQRARSLINRTKTPKDQQRRKLHFKSGNSLALPALSVKKSQAFFKKQVQDGPSGEEIKVRRFTSVRTFIASLTSTPGHCHCRHVVEVEVNPWHPRRKEMAILLSLCGCLRARYRRSPTQKASTMPIKAPRMTCIFAVLAADAEQCAFCLAYDILLNLQAYSTVVTVITQSL